MKAEQGAQIAAHGAELSEQLAQVSVPVDESIPGWKGRDITRMDAMSEIQGQQLDVLDEASSAMASELHDQWRNENQNPHEVDGKIVYEPRVKILAEVDGEQKWFNDGKVPENATEIKRQDIANTPYDQLDKHWQAENKAAADVVVGLMVERNGKIDLDDPATRSEVGGIIHDAWLTRNPWEQDGELGVPFDQLDETQQAKDLSQIVTAQRLFGGESEQAGSEAITDAETAR